MKFVKKLTQEEIISLQCMAREHPLAYSRIRATSVLMSNQIIPVKKIAILHGVSRQTVSIWLKNWDSYGICGLVDKPGRGRKKKTNHEEEEVIIETIKKTPRSLKKALLEIEKELNIKLSIKTLKRICKRAGLSWKRVRKSLRGKRDDEQFYMALDEIKSLCDQSDRGEIDFYYFDESGFTLEPCVPYAWQAVGDQIEVPSSKSKRLNVLGFIDRNNNFESYVFECNIVTDVVVACFNDFVKNITKKTVVLIDNASMHTSHAFKENIKKWESQNLFIQNIPAYSPELNKIEILWRKIKYEWLDFSSYESFSSLKEDLYYVLSNIGEEYRVKFT